MWNVWIDHKILVDQCLLPSRSTFNKDNFSFIALPVLSDQSPDITKTLSNSNDTLYSSVIDTGTTWSVISKHDLVSFTLNIHDITHHYWFIFDTPFSSICFPSSWRHFLLLSIWIPPYLYWLFFPHFSVPVCLYTIQHRVSKFSNFILPDWKSCQWTSNNSVRREIFSWPHCPETVYYTGWSARISSSGHTNRVREGSD